MVRIISTVHCSNIRNKIIVTRLRAILCHPSVILVSNSPEQETISQNNISIQQENLKITNNSVYTESKQWRSSDAEDLEICCKT